MARKAFPWLSITLMIALLVALAPAPSTQAQFVPEVNGLFYGDDDYLGYDLVGYGIPDPQDPPPYCGDNPAYSMYKKVVGTTLYVAVVESRCLNDNVFASATYSTYPSDQPYLNSAYWVKQGTTQNHRFYELYDSDHMCFELHCAGDPGDGYAWCQDYLYDGNGNLDPNEADWLSDINGPDPAGVPDVPPPGLVSSSSLAWNMNYTQWDVTLGGARPLSNDWKSPNSSGVGSVFAIEVTNGGSGYTSPPAVTISGGGGSGATAVAVIDAGQVIAVNVTNGGSGYTSPPAVTFSGGGGGAATALSRVDTLAVTDEEGYPVGWDPIRYNSVYDWEWPLVYEWSADLSNYCPNMYFDLMVVSSHNSPTKGGGEDPPPLAVDLLWFKAKPRAKWALLSWETASETNNLGFYLWRATSPDGERTRVNAQIIPSAVPPAGGGAVYRYVDWGLQKKTTYYYWLQDLDIYGVQGWSEPLEVRTK